MYRVYRKFLFLSIFFVDCEDIICLPDDGVVICKFGGKPIAILDKNKFSYAKRIFVDFPKHKQL